MKSIARFVFVTISMLILPYGVPEANTAEIETSSRSACPLQLVGPIVKGDFEKFAQAASRIGLSNLQLSEVHGAEYSVCLNSVGGSWIESMKIARHVFDNGIGTRIEAGGECYSACAVIFMAGRIRGDENDGPWRYLSARGRLGFHAPYLNLDHYSPGPEQTYTAADVAGAFNIANRMMSEFMYLFSYRSIFMDQPWIRPSLIAEMSSAGRNELVLVDTVERAFRWGISLYGLRPVSSGGMASIVQLCLNVQSWLKDARSKTATAREAEDKTIYPVTKLGNYWRVDTGGLAEQYCLIKRVDLDFTVCVVDDFRGQRHGNCPEYGLQYPGLAAQPPSTQIRSLAFSD